MKKITYKAGEYSQLKLPDSSNIFLQILPHSVKVSKMLFYVIPTKTIWSFNFPFYIRTSDNVWITSKVILDIIIETIKDVNNYDELTNILKSTTNLALQEYVKEHDEEILEISIDRVGSYAQEQLNKSNFIKYQPILSKFGKVLEETSKENITKYPASVYPESLLPYSKEEIEEALFNMRYCINDEKQINALDIGEICLGDFIDDEDAYNKNLEMSKMFSAAESLNLKVE